LRRPSGPSCGYPAGNPHTQNLNQFAATSPRRPAPAQHHRARRRALFKAQEIKRAVQTGQAQIGEVLMSLLENENPVFGADAVPFVRPASTRPGSSGRRSVRW